MAKKYDLLFEGKIRNNIDISLVKENLKKFFNINSNSVEQLFSKEITVFKRNLSSEQANKYKTALETTGILCSIIESIDIIEPKNQQKDDLITDKVDDLLVVTFLGMQKSRVPVSLAMPK